MEKKTEKLNFNRVNKTWKKPIINQLNVSKTLGGTGGNVENRGHPDGSPKSGTGGLAY